MSGPVTAIFENMGKVDAEGGASRRSGSPRWSRAPGRPKSLAGKPRTTRPGSLKRAVELFERVVLRGEAALGGDVDDEQDFAAIVGEGGGVRR